MSSVSPQGIAKALARQQSLQGQAWIDRCDELAEQQRVMFLKLVTFARDGVTDGQFRALIDFLSVIRASAPDGGRTCKIGGASEVASTKEK